jgi:TPR repeat protein
MGCINCEAILKGEPNEMQEGYQAYDKEDFLRALALLLPFAEKGEAMAQCLVATIYHMGLGIEKNPEEGRRWYLAAGEQGCGLSYNNLATLHVVCNPNDMKAWEQSAKWFDKALELGFNLAGHKNPYR